MNEITIIIWIVIALIAIISIIIVKLHYKDNEKEEGSEIDIINDKQIQENLSLIKENEKKDNDSKPDLSPYQPKNTIKFKKGKKAHVKNDAYVTPEVEKNNLKNYEYENQNKVLINYDNKIKKFQEPIKQNQMDIMTRNINKNKEETELKDLFTIDELIKESKRKDSQREKESRTIKRNDGEDKELDDIKRSIKNKKEEPLIEDVLKKDSEDTIDDLINNSQKDIQTQLTQQEVDQAISKAANERKREITKPDNITSSLLTEEKKQKAEQEKISDAPLKTPTKISASKDNDMNPPIDDSNLNEESEEETMDLDYRKDLDKFANKIKESKLFQEFKDKITPETEEEYPEEEDYPQEEDYIRTVNEYNDFEPIVNETHIDYEDKYGLPNMSEEDKLRQENTKKVFNLSKTTKTTKKSSSKSSKDSIEIKLNNNEVTLKKGDEIIFNHLGETYSSQVYAIKGDDISVKYRRKFIKIKPKDVKKIY